MNDAGDLFDQYAAAYEQALSNAIAPSGESREYFAEGRVAWLKRCLEERKQPAGSLLDFGCGDGATTPLLLQTLNAKSAVGVDVSAKSLEIARKRHASERIRYESIGEFQSSGQMDLAYCNGVFHHILPAQRAAALAMVHRALREGGFFSFWENNPWSLATRYVCRVARSIATPSCCPRRKRERCYGTAVLRSCAPIFGSSFRERCEHSVRSKIWSIARPWARNIRSSAARLINPYFSLQSWSVECKPSRQQRTRAFRSAGASPAIFLISTRRKNAGETPALLQIAPVNQTDCY